jgi:hypothetical protein
MAEGDGGEEPGGKSFEGSRDDIGDYVDEEICSRRSSPAEFTGWDL